MTLSIASRSLQMLRCAPLLLGATLLAGSASAQFNPITRFTNPTIGNWFIPGNWNNGVPQAGYDAVMDNGIAGLAFISDPGAVANGLYMSTQLDVTGAGRLTVNTSNFSGSLRIAGGGRIVSGFTDLSLSGVATVTDPSSLWTTGDFRIGGFGTGDLSVQSGGRVASSSSVLGSGTSLSFDGIGKATITGTGSTWSTSGDLTLGVGGAPGIGNGTGTLEVRSGGLVSNFRAYVGESAGSSGSVLVTDAGSSWTGDGSFFIGNGGNGSLQVLNGGSASTAGNSYLGFSPGGYGQAIIDGAGSSWNTDLELIVAGNQGTAGGGSGYLSVSNGALVTSGAARIATEFGKFGTTIVSGNGSSWVNSGDMTVGSLGIGSLDVSAGASVSTQRGYVGQGTGSSGTVVVRDAGSSWNGTGSFFIGVLGDGLLHVLNGASASTEGNSYLGFATGSSGAAVVDGAGSTWNTALELVIGGNQAAAGGSGSLRISNGGTVNAGFTTLWDTGVLDLVGDTNFSGPLHAEGGLIRTTNDTALSNAITLGSGGLVVLNSTPGSTSTFSGDISGAGGLTKSGVDGVTGVGTLVLSGANTYTGPTIVNSGTLLINGSNVSPVIVNGGILGGRGVNLGAVVVGDGIGVGDAVLAPGASIATFSSGDLTLHSDVIVQFEFDSSSILADRLDVMGTVELGDALFAFKDFEAAPITPGVSFILIDNDGLDAIVGAFSNLPEGFLFADGPNTFRASYFGGTGNDLSFTAVPEPGTVAMLLFGFAVLGSRSRPRG